MINIQEKLWLMIQWFKMWNWWNNIILILLEPVITLIIQNSMRYVMNTECMLLMKQILKHMDWTYKKWRINLIILLNGKNNIYLVLTEWSKEIKIMHA